MPAQSFQTKAAILPRLLSNKVGSRGLLQFVWFPTLSGLLCVRSLALYSISSRLSPSFLAFLTELYLKIQEQTSNLKEFAAP